MKIKPTLPIAAILSASLFASQAGIAADNQNFALSIQL